MVFHNINFYSTTLISDERYQHISMPSWYRPLHSRFSSVIFQTFWPWVFCRPPAYR